MLAPIPICGNSGKVWQMIKIPNSQYGSDGNELMFYCPMCREERRVVIRNGVPQCGICMYPLSDKWRR
jgi:hypothetical protein